MKQPMPLSERESIAFIFLLFSAVLDVKEREISPAVCAVTLSTGLFLNVLEASAEREALIRVDPGLQSPLLPAAAFLLPYLPGLLLLLLVPLARGGIGAGDGIAVLVMGSLLPFSAVVSVLLTALLFTAGGGVFLLLRGRFGQDRRSQKAGSSYLEVSLPFMPFLFLGYAAGLILEGVRAGTF